jgi:hypothetical protein
MIAAHDSTYPHLVLQGALDGQATTADVFSPD